ncbi:MAG: thermonuclease family protein [Planctomycetota bacterium]|jgi:micrococcal nuclease
MSRRRKTGILILCLLPVALFIWLDHSLTRHKPQAQPESDEQAKAYDFQKYHTKTFTVVNVVDGDTVDVDVPDGEYKYTRIRLWGIDTPETKSDEFGVMYFGPQAAEFTIKLTFGKPVTLYLDVDNSTRDKFERLLAYVQLPDGGYLNEVLVAEGFAYADLRFRHSFYNKYRQLEAGARSGQKGLWQKVTREQLPKWLQSEKPNLLNK